MFQIYNCREIKATPIPNYTYKVKHEASENILLFKKAIINTFSKAEYTKNNMKEESA